MPDLFVQRVWPTLARQQRIVLELWKLGLPSYEIGDFIGEDSDTVGWMIGVTLCRIRGKMKELMMGKYPWPDEKAKEGSHFDRVRLREHLQQEYPAEVELTEQLPSSELPEKWDIQLLAQIKHHLALIKRRLSE